MGRRSHGEGSIYKRETDGLWVAQYLVDTPDGRTKRKYIYGKKRKDVADKLAEVLIYPNIGHLRLSKLNALHVQRLYARKLDEGLRPGTVRLIHANLSKALQKAVRWRLVGVNVARSATAPIEQRRRGQAVDEGRGETPPGCCQGG